MSRFNIGNMARLKSPSSLLKDGWVKDALGGYSHPSYCLVINSSMAGELDRLALISRIDDKHVEFSNIGYTWPLRVMENWEEIGLSEEEPEVIIEEHPAKVHITASVLTEQSALAEIFFTDFLGKLDPIQKIRAAKVLISEFEPHNPILQKLCGDTEIFNSKDVPRGAWMNNSRAVDTGPYVVACQRMGSRLAFVKLVMNKTGLGLKEAKDVVDNLLSPSTHTVVAYNLSLDWANEWVADINYECPDAHAQVGILI